MRLRVTLLCVDEVGEFGRISDEEDRGVVEHPVQVALLGSDLDSEATRITSSIRGPEFTANSRKSNSGTMLLAGLCEELGGGNVFEALSQFEVTMCTSTFGMDLWWMVDIVRRDEREIGLQSGRTTRSGIRSRSKCARRSMW